RAYLCHRHLLFKGWLKQPNPSNQKRIMQIPSSKCRASGFVQSQDIKSSLRPSSEMSISTHFQGQKDRA
ncbi:hypothetical protein, partial [Rhizobium leguminosarum]|uniref:hypothetical protein n=1 Tax=Rhizobium leguminosarum TaxID=384 RepID=UPI001C98293A